MIQNSLDVLFDGMLRTLQGEVLAALEDDYARSQLEATADLLAQLAERVTWREDEIRETVRRARGVLRAALAVEPSLEAARACLAEAVPGRRSGLLRSRDRHLDALAAVQRWVGESGSEAIQHRLDRFVDWQLETETVLLRRARARARRTSASREGG